jgi:Secretion system effector C (SseC) like family
MIASVENVTGAPLPASQPPASGSTPPPVMPEPQTSLGNLANADMMSAIYALMSKQRSTDMTAAKANVNANGAIQKAEQTEQQQAIVKQEQAEQSAAQWGLFGKIASVIAIAVSAVASVCSCGAASALCAAACILSATAFVEGQTNVLTKITGNPDVDKAFQIGCGIAAACCSGGAGIATLGSSVVVGASQILSSGAKVGQEVLGSINDSGCQEAALAVGIGGAVAGAIGSFGAIGNVGTAAASTAGTVVKAATDATNGAAEIGAGVATVVEAQYDADATDRTADAKQDQQIIDRFQQLTQFVIDGAKTTDDAHKQALQTLTGAMQTQDQTLVIASTKV